MSNELFYRVKMKDCYNKINFNLIIFILAALLSGARNEKNVHLSQQIFDRMKKLFPDLTNPLVSAAVLLSNVYGSSGKIEKASDIKMQLIKSGLKKKIGLSWTSVNGKHFVSLEL
jgi:hypothetical protein